MAHTPGPWVHNATRGRNAAAVWDVRERTFICSVNDPPGRYACATESEQHDNCVLIAAAPQMADALIIARAALLDAIALAKLTGFTVVETSTEAALAAVIAALDKARES